MQPTLRFTVVTVLMGLLAVPQADARGGGGAAGGGGARGGAAVAIHVGNFHNGVTFRNGFTRRQGFAHLNGLPLRDGQFARNNFNNFQNGIPWGWGGVWPVWGGDWWPGGGYADQPVQQAEAPAPSQPQVIVIHSDGNGNMNTAEAAPPDLGVAGCHAIANGYHCDEPTTTR